MYSVKRKLINLCEKGELDWETIARNIVAELCDYDLAKIAIKYDWFYGEDDDTENNN